MDPLSITAAVVGLLAAAGQVGSVLSKIKSSVSDAPESIQRVLLQVKELEACFAAVHKSVIGATSASRRRLSMIEVDQLVATLTESVLTFSELERIVKPFETCIEASIRHRVKWAWKEEDVSRIMLRLDRHKSSLSLMLNIVQCESDLEAGQSQQSLLVLVQQLVESNLEVSRRLQILETTFETESILTACFRNGNPSEIRELEEMSTDVPGVSQRTASIVFGNSSPGLQTLDFNPAFEVDLNDSRVYKRTQPYECDVSFTSSAVRSHSWSVFSGLSLSQISSISVIALPIYSYEISNQERYEFLPVGKPDRQATPRLATVDENIQNKDGLGRQQASLPEDKWAYYKLVVVGDNNVGKTALTRQLIAKEFVDSYDPTVEERYTIRAVIDGRSCTIDIRDTGNQEEYIVWTALADQWIRSGEAFLLVYSVANRTSFERVSRFHTQINRVKDRSDAPVVILVGNKTDKIEDRAVTRKEAEDLARELECGYMETSAKNNVDVERAFYDLVRRLRQQQEKGTYGMYSPAPRQYREPQKKNKGVPRVWQRVRARPA